MCSAEQLKAIIDDTLKPFVGRIVDLEGTVFGEEWDGGLKGWANKQNGYLKGIRLMLVIGLPIITAFNIAVLVAVLAHIGRGP